MKTIVYLLFSALLSLIITGCATIKTNGTGPDYDKEGARKAVTVTQTKRGAVITSDERILFETGKSDITNNGQVFIDRVAKIIRDKTKANVSIEGHTDNVGSQDLNQRLSERRAASVMQALTAKGVARSRVTMKGYGMTKPVADNGTPDGRQANRRTEIIVLGENAENLGGTSLADSLSEGLDRFLKNAGEFIQSAFGNKE